MQRQGAEPQEEWLKDAFVGGLSLLLHWAVFRMVVRRFMNAHFAYSAARRDPRIAAVARADIIIYDITQHAADMVKSLGTKSCLGAARLPWGLSLRR
jgi:hypothetical protein